MTSSVTFYRLGAAGRYAEVQPRDGRLASSVLPGFWLDPAWLAQDPLPSEQATLFHIGGEAYRQYARGQLGL